MQERDDIRKIGLMITNEKHVTFWKILNIFCAGNFELVDNHQSRIGNNSYKEIDDLADDMYIFYSFRKGHAMFLVSNRN